MSFIRTVLGDISPAELGVCYAHEHIIIDPCFATDKEPDFLLDDVEKAVAELKELKEIGVGAVIDAMPGDCGRNIESLTDVSQQSHVHIVAPTGVHLAKYYDSGHWSHFYDALQLSNLFYLEIIDGLDLHNYSGPIVRVCSDWRAGIIKIAALEDWDKRTQTIFCAAAQTQQKTGCPILTHTENGELALEQAQFLQENGADLNHVVLSHLDRKPDLEYHRKVLQTGVTIEYDSHFRTQEKPNPTLELLKKLLPEFPDQIVLGMDAARRKYWKNYGGVPGLGWLYTDFRAQMLDAGIAEELVQKAFVSTPARVFSFGKDDNL